MKRTRNLQLPLLAALLTSTLFTGQTQAVDVILLPDFTLGCTGNCGTASATGTMATSLGFADYGFLSTNTTHLLTATTSLNLPEKEVNLGGGVKKVLEETNGSLMVSSNFAASQGQQLRVNFNYITTDADEFGDYAWAKIVNASTNASTFLFTARSTTQGNSVIPGGNDMPAIGADLSGTPDVNDTKPDWGPLGDSNNTCFNSLTNNGCGFTGWLTSTYTFANSGDYRLEFGVTNWGDTRFNSGLAFQFAGMTSPTPEPSTFLLMSAALALFGVNASRRRKRT